MKQNNLTFTSPLSSNENTVSIDLSLYDKIVVRDSAIRTSSNTLQTNINTTNTNLTTNYYNETTLDNMLHRTEPETYGMRGSAISS